MSKLQKVSPSAQTEHPRVMFCHYREGDVAFTIAYQHADSTQDGTFVNVAYAYCSKKDQYCKKTGRNISSGRLATKPNVFSFAGSPTNKEIVRQAISAGLDDFGTYTLAEGGQSL